MLVFTAVPYGTAEAWWKAAFVFLVFAASILWIVEGFFSGSWTTGARTLLLPWICLTLFCFCQTISLPFARHSVPGLKNAFWNSISADPYGSRFVALQLLGLLLAAALLFRYSAREQRVRSLINLIVCLAVGSALFGLLRQTTQHVVGFGLPMLKPNQGYGQFINKNHFAFLMEMAFGLLLGLVVAGGVKRDRILVYCTGLIPIWTALVLSNSRGGLIAMLAQVISVVLLFKLVVPIVGSDSPMIRVVSLVPVRGALLLLLIAGIVVGMLWLGGDRLASNIEAARNEFENPKISAREAVRRKDIWLATWPMFRDHPIAGVGIGGYWAAIPTYHQASGTMTPQQAHNDYLELLASGGIIGIILIGWFAFVLVQKTWANLTSTDRFRRASSFGASIAIIGVAVHSLVDFGLHLTVNALVFVALIVIAAGNFKIARGSQREVA